MMITLMALVGLAVDHPIEAPLLPSWMAGCWMAEGDGNQTEECWTVPRGAMMLASSHTFVPGDTRAFEHMRIVREGGTLVFIAQPGGNLPVRFVLTPNAMGSLTARQTVAFRNLANDYPQIIQYYSEADGSMIAEISMADGSRSQRWVFRRVGQ